MNARRRGRPQPVDKAKDQATVGAAAVARMGDAKENAPSSAEANGTDGQKDGGVGPAKSGVTAKARDGRLRRGQRAGLGESGPSSRLVKASGKYTSGLYPTVGAMFTSFYSGSGGGGGGGGGGMGLGGLNDRSELAMVERTWRLYSIWQQVMRDYAAVFSMEGGGGGGGGGGAGVSVLRSNSRGSSRAGSSRGGGRLRGSDVGLDELRDGMSSDDDEIAPPGANPPR